MSCDVLTYLAHTVAVLHKTCSVQFRTVFNAEVKVAFVLFRQKRHVKFYVGHKQTFAVAQRSAVLSNGVDYSFIDARNFEHKQPVVKQQSAPFADVLVQFAVGD